MPTVGQTAGENLAAITVGADAHYTLESARWRCSSGGDREMGDSEVFEEGKYYYAAFVVKPEYGYYFDASTLPAALVNGSDEHVDADNTRTYGEGSVIFYTADLLPGSAAGINYGDVNNDGKTDGKDLIRLRKHLVGADVEIGPGADCNGDGEINGKDLIRLRKYLLTEDASLLGPQ
jgi:hypothetical protein